MSKYIVNSDSYFCMGSTHKICEDYAISGLTPRSYVILSDGCSSAKHTDVGSRILCHLTEKILVKENIFNPDVFIKNILKSMESALNLLGMQTNNFYGTLVLAYEENDMVKVVIFGDGSVITVDREGHVMLHNVLFNTNAPDYLAYHLDEKFKKAYQMTNTIKSINQYEYELFKPIVMKFPMSNFETIAIASDGLNSFIPKGKLSDVEIARKFVSFKNFNGEYVKRRAAKAIKEIEKEGLVHFDDLSIGSIHIKQSGD
ncbi:MAG: protein phosphatase 2C domain-containing protein [Desulfobacterales bacterium]|nr:protein phosphatase 2C domain-containing protein [Desulfobacterales bacterium]